MFRTVDIRIFIHRNDTGISAGLTFRGLLIERWIFGYSSQKNPLDIHMNEDIHGNDTGIIFTGSF